MAMQVNMVLDVNRNYKAYLGTGRRWGKGGTEEEEEGDMLHCQDQNNNNNGNL